VSVSGRGPLIFLLLLLLLLLLRFLRFFLGGGNIFVRCVCVCVRVRVCVRVCVCVYVRFFGLVDENARVMCELRVRCRRIIVGATESSSCVCDC